MNYQLFLDDERFPSLTEDPNVNWIIVRNYKEFIRCIAIYGMPKFISFDHDLGEGRDGYDCAKWLANICIDCDVDIPEFYVHSQNPVGAVNINSYLTSAKNFIDNERKKAI